MAREPNEVIGKSTCSEGGETNVYQTKKAGKHFYERCECCGLNQGTGAKRQQRIWDTASFIDGAKYVRPSNVSETVKPALSETVKPALSEVVEPTPSEVSEPSEPAPSEVSEEVNEDYNPNDEAETLESSENEPMSWKKKLLVTTLSLTALGAGFIWG